MVKQRKILKILTSMTVFSCFMCFFLCNKFNKGIVFPIYYVKKHKKEVYFLYIEKKSLFSCLENKKSLTLASHNAAMMKCDSLRLRRFNGRKKSNFIIEKRDENSHFSLAVNNMWSIGNKSTGIIWKVCNKLLL